MRRHCLLLALLVACRSGTPEIARSPPDAAPPPPLPVAPPPDERLTLVQPLELHDETLLGPRLLEGRPPSATYPEGTVFCESWRKVEHDEDGGESGSGYYVFVIATREGGFVVARRRDPEDGSPEVLTMASFDARGVPRGRATQAVPATTMFYFYDQRIHAGDSIYSLILDAEGRPHLARFDDRTLQERSRSAVLPGSEHHDAARWTMGVLRKTDEHWLAWIDANLAAVSPGLDAIDLNVPLSGYADDVHQGKRLATDTTPPGSLVSGACTPRWAHGRPLFACIGERGLTMVRSAEPVAPLRD